MSGLEVNQRANDFPPAEIVQGRIHFSELVARRKQRLEVEPAGGDQFAIAGKIAVGDVVAAPGAEQALARLSSAGIDFERSAEAGVADDHGGPPAGRTRGAALAHHGGRCPVASMAKSTPPGHNFRIARDGIAARIEAVRGPELPRQGELLRLHVHGETGVQPASAAAATAHDRCRRPRTRPGSGPAGRAVLKRPRPRSAPRTRPGPRAASTGLAAAA